MWLIGIDEAGYGPNLGPLVMTSVACRAPKRLAKANLWQVLAHGVRQHGDKDDGRPLVADSKLVYSPSRGLGDLEKGVLGIAGHKPATVAGYLEWACPAALEELAAECWFRGTTALPIQTDGTEIRAAQDRFAEVCSRRDVVIALVRSVVVCPARFNRLVDRWDSKAAVLGLGLAELLHLHHNPHEDDEDVSFVIDKHGGRNQYSAMVQHAIPEGLVLAREEGARRSVYEVLGLNRSIRVTFEPRADTGHFCVALASMLSKYLREVLMLEFNRFWQNEVPGLKATAGYPGDAERFYAAIRASAQRLQISEQALWRKR
jgi:ribonuclease HII